MVGEILGHYLIDAKIGEGQFAVVYAGHDLRLNRRVAVKVLKESHEHCSTIWGRLLREARVASTLNHPCICTLFDIGEDEDINYVVFEFIEGCTLRTLLNSGPLPTRTAFQYAIQIAEAMAHIHGAGILQLDLKSSNIMVTPAGRIKVIDFGLAKIIQEEQAKESGGQGSSAQEVAWIAGTLPYMAPELLHGEAPTTRAGVWALGVVIFEMLTGELPFIGRTPYELGLEIMTGMVSSLPADIPVPLRAIVQRCLVRDIEHRYYSAAEVLNHLRSEFIGHEVEAILASRAPKQDRGYMSDRFGNLFIWLSLHFFGH